MLAFTALEFLSIEHKVKRKRKAPQLMRRPPFPASKKDYFLKLSSTATATATVAPTIGLLPMPIRPIIST